MVQVYRSCLKHPSFIQRYTNYAFRKLGLERSCLTKVRDANEAWERLEHKEFPISVNIVLGNQCNYHCGHCPYHGPTAPSYFTEKNEKMQWCVLEKLMEELPNYKTNAKFGAFEEPLMYEEFRILSESFISKGVGVHLTTNGVLLGKFLDVVRNLTSIYVSLDASNPATYEQIRGGNFLAVTGSILKLVKQRTDKLKRLGVSFIEEPLNYTEREKFLSYWLSFVDMVIFYALLDFTKDNYVITSPYLKLPKERVVCSSPWLETYVYPNGDVSLCCQTLVMTGRRTIPIMGNIKEQSLYDIWHGEKYEKYRKALLTEDWDYANICKDCLLWSASYYKKKRIGNLLETRNPTTRVIEKCGRN